MDDEKMDVTITHHDFRYVDVPTPVTDMINISMRTLIVTFHCIDNKTGEMFRIGPMKAETKGYLL